MKRAIIRISLKPKIILQFRMFRNKGLSVYATYCNPDETILLGTSYPDCDVDWYDRYTIIKNIIHIV